MEFDWKLIVHFLIASVIFNWLMRLYFVIRRWAFPRRGPGLNDVVYMPALLCVCCKDEVGMNEPYGPVCKACTEKLAEMGAKADGQKEK